MDSSTLQLVLTAGLSLGVGWVAPIALGIAEARKKGRSPHWMWFGVHPLGGWLAYLILKFKAEERPACPACRMRMPTDARFCPWCKAGLQGDQARAEGEHPKRIGVVRWARGKLQCGQCLRFMPLAAAVCPGCGGGGIKPMCPGCGGRNARLFRPAVTLIASIAVILIGCLLDAERNARNAGPGYGALWITAGAAGIWYYFSRLGWRIACADCATVRGISKEQLMPDSESQG